MTAFALAHYSGLQFCHSGWQQNPLRRLIIELRRRTEVSQLTLEVANVLVHSQEQNAGNSHGFAGDEVRRFCEDYLVTRIVASLAHVMPQLQNLIVTSVAGSLTDAVSY